MENIMIKNIMKSVMAIAACGAVIVSTTAPVSAAPATAAQPAAAQAAPVVFNRLMKKQSPTNLPPAQDGIHDPTVDAAEMLQPPLQGMNGLTRSNFGNNVDWVNSLQTKKVMPRWDRVDPKAESMVMNVDIVRVPRGSMPDVVFPHKAHTEWLECSNCHPAIFVPQKGANQISMASMILGRNCGTCHGKVAFPISECKLCHNQKKVGMAP